MAEKDHIIIESGDALQPFAYGIGMHGSRFFAELRNRRFVGIKCPKCGKVFIPPEARAGIVLQR